MSVRRSPLARQARSRDAVRDAVARWVGLSAATAQRTSWVVPARTRDGVPVEVIVTIDVIPAP